VGLVVFLDFGGVGDEGVGAEGGEGFGEVVPGAGEAVPLFAFAFEAVDVEGGGGAGAAGEGGEDGVGAVAEEGGVVGVPHEVEGGVEGMGEGFGVFVAEGGEVLEVDAAVGGGGVAIAAVDGDVVAAEDEPGGELFGEGFKAAVTGRDPTGPEDGNTH